MRTTEFRGKYEDGKWVYGYYAKLSNEFKEWHCIMSEIDSKNGYIKDCNGYDMRYTPVDPETVGQFTGLLDKDGKEIYEGDIVHFHYLVSKTGYSELFPTEKFYGVISKDKYNNWCILANELEIHIENAIRYGVVIGNIHDNPELLKGVTHE